jgi:hypothetical protein
MPKFKVFSISELDKTSSDRTQTLKNQTLYCNIQKNVKNSTWSNLKDNNVMVTQNNNGDNEISKFKSYDMMNSIHKGFYSYKQDISGYCFEGGINIDSSNIEFQLFDLLYTGYTYADLTGVLFDPNDLCNLTSYYSMVKLEDNNLKYPNKFQKIYKFPTPIILE